MSTGEYALIIALVSTPRSDGTREYPIVPESTREYPRVPEGTHYVSTRSVTSPKRCRLQLALQSTKGELQAKARLALRRRH